MTSTPAAHTPTDAEVQVILRTHRSDLLAYVWRTGEEERLHRAWTSTRELRGIGMGLSAVMMLATAAVYTFAVLGLGEPDGRQAMTYMMPVFFVFGAAAWTRFFLRARQADRALAEFAPRMVTPAAQWAYTAARDYEPTRAEAEEHVAALDGLSAAEQVKHPAHDALLRLGLRADTA